MKDRYLELRKKIKAYNFALSTISYDAETIAPKDSFNYRMEMVSTLVAERMNIYKSDEYAELVEGLSKTELDNVLKREIELELKDLNKNKNVSKELLMEYSKANQIANRKWEEAREQKDFNVFKEALNNLIVLIKKIKALQKHNVHPYDQLLDENEEGYSMEKYDEFFNVVREEIVPLIKEVEVIEKMDYVFDQKAQEAFISYLIETIHFDMNKGLLGESIHPFTTHTHSSDVRFTVAYDDSLESTFAAFHELGHAMYNQQISPELDMTYLSRGVSPGIHESQSRFYENIIGRSKAFWDKHFDVFKTYFPDLPYEKEEFYRRMNRVEPSLIRVAADELTYPVHILIRYEIEKYIFSENFDIDNLNEKWNDLYEEYLGIRPENDLVGILQDIHWSWGYFGYFPTYALGSAIASQIYYTSSVDIDALIGNNDIETINKYLRENIHTFGGLKTPSELIEGISGEEFNAKYYVRYLKEKYSRR